MVYSYVLDILVSHSFRLKLINNFFGLLLSVRQGKMIISESHYAIQIINDKLAIFKVIYLTLLIELHRLNEKLVIIISYIKQLLQYEGVRCLTFQLKLFWG